MQLAEWYFSDFSAPIGIVPKSIGKKALEHSPNVVVDLVTANAINFVFLKNKYSECNKAVTIN